MSSTATILASVQSHIRIRANATDHFGDVATIEPAWQILLYLFSTELEGAQPKHGNLRAALNFPDITIKRCLNFLQSKGHVVFLTSSDSTAEANLLLSEQAREMMALVFAAA